MARPVVGIIGNSHLINDQYEVHAGGQMNTEAVSGVSDCVPFIIPADPRHLSVNELMEVCDGFLFTGGRPNVHPEEYGEAATEAHGAFDRARDAIVLPLIRACVERGQPFFGNGGHALPRNPRSAGPDEPPDAARWHHRGEVRAAP